MNAPALDLATALVVLPAGRAAVADGAGARAASPEEARALFEAGPVLLAHAAMTARRLGLHAPPRSARLFDVLELFAFVRPARFCAPSAVGLARAAGLAEPSDAPSQAVALRAVAGLLLVELAASPTPSREEALALAETLGRAGWAWAAAVIGALRSAPLGRAWRGAGLDVWGRLAEWEDQAPPGEAGSKPIDPAAAAERLAELLARAGLDEARPMQAEFAAEAAHAFQPREREGEPMMMLAEAGTGVGKTLAYLAPASLWAEANGPGGLDLHLHPRPAAPDRAREPRGLSRPHVRARKAVVRKGRENYLCLLNFQEAVNAAHAGRRRPDRPGPRRPLGARHPRRRHDRRRFPGLAAHPVRRRAGGPGQRRQPGRPARRVRPRRLPPLPRLLHRKGGAGLAAGRPGHRQPRPGADPGRLRRRARARGAQGRHRDDHAQAHRVRRGPPPVRRRRQRLFRRPVGRRGGGDAPLDPGPGGRGRRGRGLEARLSELLGEREDSRRALDEAVRAAAALPGEGWSGRIAPGAGAASPSGPIEAFLVAVLEQLRARAAPSEVGMECAARPALDQVRETARAATVALSRVEAPLLALARKLEDVLDAEAETLTTAERARIEGALRGLDRRARMMLPAWRSMLRAIDEDAEDDPDFVDWFDATFLFGRVVDAACRRHWVDPTGAAHRRGHRPGPRGAGDQRHPGRFHPGRPLRPGRNAHRRGPAARTAQDPAPGLALRLWRQRPRPGGHRRRPRRPAPGGRGHARAVPGRRRGRPGPVHRHPPAARGPRAGRRPTWRARAWPSTPSTSIRWRSGALVDIFRAEEDACLLGTDAVRDGVDVPGRSLRLLVFDRVPWPRPDILHKARRGRFGGKAYDDAVARGRIAQAFGRLIRRADDKGVFVMLDPAAPTRLFSGLPEGVTLERVGLVDAIEATAAHLRG